MDEILTWATTMNFDSIHFNLMHDPFEFSLSCIPCYAQSEIMIYLQKMQVKWTQYAQDIDALKRIVVSSKFDSTTELHNKLRQTDLYRDQNFATSHAKMARAIRYDR